MKQSCRTACSLLLTAAILLSVLPLRPLAVVSVLSPENTNGILDGQLEQRPSDLFACFNGLAAGEEYLVILSRSNADPLAPENLIYLTQAAASDLGTLEVPFRSAETDIPYVVACRRDLPDDGLTAHAIVVEGGTASAATAAPGAVITINANSAPDKTVFSGWSVLSGNITLADASAEETTFVMGAEDVRITAVFKEKSEDQTPETPTVPQPSSSGSGTSFLLLGAGAAAIVAGVVLLAPVELSGRLESADHQPVPDAVITLSQDGVRTAQTSTDSTGAFGFRVRRGNYDLTVSYRTASGELSQTTLRVKAPFSGLNLTAASEDS